MFAVATARLPLGSYADRRSFKVYSLDVGLLGALAGTAPQLLVHGDDLFAEYRGALVENYVAQQLAAASGAAPGTPATAGGLYFWRSTGGMAEVDFLLERCAASGSESGNKPAQQEPAIVRLPVLCPRAGPCGSGLGSEKGRASGVLDGYLQQRHRRHVLPESRVLVHRPYDFR